MAVAARPIRSASPDIRAPRPGARRAQVSGARAQPARRVGSTGQPAPLRVIAGGLDFQPSAGVVARLVQGRLFVGVIALLLVGLVVINVHKLEINKMMASQAARAAVLDRTNSALREKLAALSSSERIQREALRVGMVMPTPEQFSYRRSKPGRDSRLAAQRITPPRQLAAAPAPQPRLAVPGQTSPAAGQVPVVALTPQAPVVTPTTPAPVAPVPAAGAAAPPAASTQHGSVGHPDPAVPTQ